MEHKLILNAKEDIPLYYEDFKKIWESTVLNFNDNDLKDCYHSTILFRNWELTMSSFPYNVIPEILKELHEDINSSFFLTLFGLHRSSHMHLRSCIELSLQYIYFCEHPVEYLLWQNGEFVIKHEKIMEYLRCHPKLKLLEVDKLLTEITKTWKFLSKHIHGEAPKYFQSTKSSHGSTNFNIADFNIWKSNLIKTTNLMNKLWLLFFKDYISIIPTQNKKIIFRNIKGEDYVLLGIKSV